MRRIRTSPFTLWLSLLGALVLTVVPLPDALEPFRPPCVTMAIIYWSMMWPRMCGILTAFIAGLMLDLLCGSLLGQHALALSVVAYLTLRFHLQIRIFPLWQLTFTAFMLMAIDAFLVFWADGIAGYPSGGIARWTQVIAGGVAWAPVMALLDNLRLRAENRSKRFAWMARAVRIKDHWAEQRLFLARLIVAGILIGILITVVLGRLVQLQLVQYDYFSTQSQGNRIRIQPVPPTRGPHPRPQRQGAGREPGELRPRADARAGAGSRGHPAAPRRQSGSSIRTTWRTSRTRLPLTAASIPIGIRDHLSDEEVARFAVNRPYFQGVEIKARLSRHYPYGPALAHALGYVGGINAADQQEFDPVEYAGTPHDRQGVRGARLRARPARHRRPGTGAWSTRAAVASRRWSARGARPGADVMLAIDLDAQLAAYEALAGKRGAVVAIDPHTGRGAGVRQHAGLRPERHQRRPEPQGLQRPAGRHRQAALQPRPARHLSARIHHQAARGAGGAALRNARTRRSACGAAARTRFPAAATAIATGSPKATAPSTCRAASSSPATCISTTSRGTSASNGWPAS